MASVVYSPRYRIDLGLHVFPTEKYRLVHDELLGRGLPSSDVVEPAAATWDELALVHTAEYLRKMRDGRLTPDDVAQLELPWSQEMVDGFRLMVGGTVQAARIACGLGAQVRSTKYEVGNPLTAGASIGPPDFVLRTSYFRVACHLGGGLHHAFPNHGEGFCPFNDVAVAIRVLQSSGVERVAVIDLDVHHGNGTAFIFNPGGAEWSATASAERDDRVFTFSMHQQHNYPMWKPRGSLDIGLADGTRDATYLRELEAALPKVMAHQPECVFYLAGADPYEDDQLGGLRLTKDGLRRRDRMVIEAVRAASVPLVIVLAGGYARRVEDTVAIHVGTIEEASNATTKARRHEEQ
jgi:acetoin utilization deacetylase AcuC-like enzyme